jgi:hypothetical protein
MEPLRIFVGLDTRQPIAYHVLCSSIQRRSSVPVSITPLLLHQLPILRSGLTEFTYARYLVPYLCDYQGTGIFLDSDMLVTGDIAELAQYDQHAVSVVPFEGKLTFERPSVMVFDCSQCQDLTPQYIDNADNHPQYFAWAPSVGELPRSWNYLVGYSAPISRADVNLIHYTQGIPGYPECRMCEFAELWEEEKKIMNSHVSWLEIMGNSVHADPVLKRLKEYL